jgi:formylglycine-generating enzyme required for sulfatase activity
MTKQFALFVAAISMLLGCATAQQSSSSATTTILTNYTEQVPGATVKFDMIAIPGGTLHKGDQKIQIKPFYIEKYEVRWPEYLLWVFAENKEADKDKLDGITHPTKPYGSIYRERGERGYPAIGMSNLAASEYCLWLSKKTGKKYRLPTEEEWEYACRAGSTTAYFWGDEASKADEYGWYIENSDDTTQQCGKKQPNAFGLYDVTGNVAEWTARATTNDLGWRAKDTLDKNNVLEWMARSATNAPAVARGGAFSEPVAKMRSSARMIETPAWNELDPQNPKSIWWLASSDFVGFRVVCEPNATPEKSTPK